LHRFDWESFLDLLYAEGGRISAILWWDYCDTSQHLVSVGSGGYRDPDNERYVYAETRLYKNGLEEKTLDEIKVYIDGREMQASNTMTNIEVIIWDPPFISSSNKRENRRASEHWTVLCRSILDQ
jgi:hypothetical protein